jgi:hypothetical protein
MTVKPLTLSKAVKRISMSKTFFLTALLFSIMATAYNNTGAQEKFTKFRFVHLEAKGSQAIMQ